VKIDLDTWWAIEFMPVLEHLLDAGSGDLDEDELQKFEVLRRALTDAQSPEAQPEPTAVAWMLAELYPASKLFKRVVECGPTEEDMADRITALAVAGKSCGHLAVLKCINVETGEADG